MVMNPWRWVDPRVASVRLAEVRTYLSSRGWQLAPNPSPNLLRFEKPGEENGRPFSYVVPASDDCSDFTQSITYLITTLSELEDRHPVEILNDILRQPADTKAPPAGSPGVPTKVGRAPR
jgi:hypothetical protein